MTTYGWKLMSELHGAGELVRQAVAAEETGLDYVAISDHYHPWLPEQDHSPFAWSVPGGVANATDRIRLTTGLTCPIGRYHPAIVAQAAATVATMCESRRFTLAVGAGERLNEHVTGEPFPAVDLRHDMLLEAIDIIRGLWGGEWTTRRGEHFDVEDARLFDLPDSPVELVVGVSGPASIEAAQRAGADGIMATDADPDLTAAWRDAGGDGSGTWSEVPFAWAVDDETGLRSAHKRFRFGALGWKVMSELPNPVNFDAACASIRPEDLADSVPHGPDPQPYVEAVQKFRDAGFEHLAIVPVGDPDKTMAFWRDEVQPALPS
ncbi:LLM class F420-dependent oxidoreductase [soil metagenome]